MTAPEVSFVIPIHDEEAILHAAVVDLRENLRDLGVRYEVILAENGSRDATLVIAGKLAARYPEVRYFSIGEPNYGAALREGILRARGDVVVCEEIDLCDVDFHERALALLRKDDADMVVGSKLLPGAHDARPRTRHAASLVYSRVLRAVVGFAGTDTHGLKAFHRTRLEGVVRACTVDKDVFASELVIRAQRASLRVVEIPVRVMEKRTPSINLVRRLPGVLTRLGKLWWAVGRR
jgi:glycosyltransferase involved in cell wall biosynthesis